MQNGKAQLYLYNYTKNSKKYLNIHYYFDIILKTCNGPMQKYAIFLYENFRLAHTKLDSIRTLFTNMEVSHGKYY